MRRHPLPWVAFFLLALAWPAPAGRTQEAAPPKGKGAESAPLLADPPVKPKARIVPRLLGPTGAILLDGSSSESVPGLALNWQPVPIDAAIKLERLGVEGRANTHLLATPPGPGVWTVALAAVGRDEQGRPTYDFALFQWVVAGPSPTPQPTPTPPNPTPPPPSPDPTPQPVEPEKYGLQSYVGDLMRAFDRPVDQKRAGSAVLAAIYEDGAARAAKGEFAKPADLVAYVAKELASKLATGYGGWDAAVMAPLRARVTAIQLKDGDLVSVADWARACREIARGFRGWK